MEVSMRMQNLFGWPRLRLASSRARISNQIPRDCFSLFLVVSMLLEPSSLVSAYGSAVDVNRNGVSDVWQVFYDVSDQDLDLDLDGDRVCTREEGIAGTHPRESTSYPRLEISTHTFPQDVEWHGVERKVYRLQTSSDLHVWKNASPPLQGIGQMMTRHISSVNGIGYLRFVQLSDSDADADSLLDWEEVLLGTDPDKDDSDGDAFEDGSEVYAYGTKPLDATSLPTTGVYVVDPAGDDNAMGSATAPFKTITKALTVVLPGQTILVRDGTYNEVLVSRAGGNSEAGRIVLRAVNPRQVTITSVGRVFAISHSFLTVAGFVFDGQSGPADTITVGSNADGLRFKNNIVRNGRRDGIDLGSNATTISETFNFLEDVLIQDCVITNMLYFDDGGNRKDAHGIVAGGVLHFTIRNTQVARVTGDALQLQDGGWNNVVVDSVHFHDGSMGEDAIDTKQDDQIPYRGHLIVRDSVFDGWDNLVNSAALNLKERVDAVVQSNIFHNNEIALRLRGRSGDNGAHVMVKNCIFYDNNKGIRYEDQIKRLRIYNNTFGTGNVFQFQSAGGADAHTFVVLNNLFIQMGKPAEASDLSNLALSELNVVDASAHDYHLTAMSDAIDTGSMVLDVELDFADNERPTGLGYDTGAYEFQMP